MVFSMTATAEQIRSDLLALPEADRAELADLLFESLDEPLSEAEERDLDGELARRAEEIRNGDVVGISATELFARLDKRLASIR